MRLENTPKFYPHGARVHHGQPFLLPHGQPFLLPHGQPFPIAPWAAIPYCPNGNSKYANDNINQLTSWPSQYLVPTMGSCHTYRGIQLCDQRARRKLRFVGSCLRPGIFG